VSVRTVGWVADFRVFEINDLEVVDQTFTRSNPLMVWLRNLDAMRLVANHILADGQQS
jgi:hypothetical protein